MGNKLKNKTLFKLQMKFTSLIVIAALFATTTEAVQLNYLALAQKGSKKSGESEKSEKPEGESEKSEKSESGDCEESEKSEKPEGESEKSEKKEKPEKPEAKGLA